MLRAGPKENPLDFHANGGGKADIAAKNRQQPEQQNNGDTAPQSRAPENRQAGQQESTPSQEASKVKDKLQAGQQLDKNSTAKGTDASKQTNSAGAQQAKDAKAQIQQLKQNIKQEQPQEDAAPSPERVAAGAAVGNPAFATGGAMLGVDMGMIAAGGAMIDAWKFMSSLAQDQSSSFGETQGPAPRSSMADMPGIDTPGDDAEQMADAEIQALEAQEAELSSIEETYAENTEHHEWREEQAIDHHEIAAPAGTSADIVHEAERKPDEFDIDYVGMNLRDVQLKYSYDTQPQEAVGQLHTATQSHGGAAMTESKPASDNYELPPPELAKIGQYADQVMSFG